MNAVGFLFRFLDDDDVLLCLSLLLHCTYDMLVRIGVAYVWILFSIYKMLACFMVSVFSFACFFSVANRRMVTINVL